MFSLLSSSETRTYRLAHNTRRIRRVVQTAAFILFFYLLLETRQEVRTVLPQNLFFLVDPLAGIAAILASHNWIAPMIIGGVTVVLASVIFGRAWCGWLCPLGTMLDWMPSREIRETDISEPRFWRHGKNLTLLIVLFTAALGSLTIVVLDPVTLLFRSLATTVLPLLNSALLLVDTWFYNFVPIQTGVAWFDTVVRIRLLGETGFYLPNLTLLAFFIAVLALSIVRPRAWCRYLCPLGGLLGFISRVSFLRYSVDNKKCISCGRCVNICSTAAINPAQDYDANMSECITCLDCVGNCPSQAISFRLKTTAIQEYRPERRLFINLIGLAAIGSFGLRFVPSSNRTVYRLVRPPGASEESLAEKCIRCGKCVKVCPTGTIQPVNAVKAWESTWTPHLELRRGYCDYSCNACGQTCPTGAIAKLSLANKRKEVIGIAVIDKKRCFPFADNKECIVCEEMCPLVPKAVTLNREQGTVAKPSINAKQCNGCGICEHQCPVNGVSAIRIFRSQEVAPPPEPDVL